MLNNKVSKLLICQSVKLLKYFSIFKFKVLILNLKFKILEKALAL